MTPQIDRLGKTSPVLRVSTDIYGVSKEIDGKMFKRSFIYNMKTPSVKQSIKLQMSSNLADEPSLANVLPQE